MNSSYPPIGVNILHRENKCKPPRSIFTAASILVWLTFVIMICGCGENDNLSELGITSDPPGAMVFLDNAYIGLTPLSLSNLSRGEHLLRVEKYDYVTEHKRVMFKREHSELHIKLHRVPKASLSVMSNPANANVYIDGEMKGKTPLLVKDLEPDVHEVRLEKKFYFPWTSEIELTASKKNIIEQTLESKIVAYYEDMIRREPKNLHNYVELAKHYVLQQNVEKAGKVFTDALETSTKYGVARDGLNRLYQELSKVYTAQYDYGDEKVQKKFKMKIEEILEAFLTKHPQSRRCYELLANFYKMTDRIDKALAFFEKASKKMPLNEDVQVTLCELYLRKGNVKKALEVGEKAKKRWNRNARLRYAIGIAQQKLGLTKDAKVNLKIALIYCGEDEKDRWLRAKINKALHELDNGAGRK